MTGIALTSGTTIFASNSLEITSNEIDSIKKNGYGNIDLFFDKIKDFFCQTNRAEAKQILSEIITPKDTPTNIDELFDRLKVLAGEGFSEHFDSDHYTEDATNQIFSLTDSDNNLVFERPLYIL